MPTTKILRTLIVKAGEKAILPSSAVIKSVVVNGSAVATSTCGTLPAPDAFKCWRFVWEDVDTVFNDANFTEIEVGGVKYNLVDIAGTTEVNTYDNGGNYLSQAIPKALPEGLVVDITNAGGTAVNPKCIAFKLPSSLGQPLIYWKNPALGGKMSFMALLPEADKCDCA